MNNNTNAQNIKDAANDTLTVATESLALAATLTAGLIKFTGLVLREAPATTEAIVSLPLATRSGYIQDHEGLTKEEADEKAFAIVHQKLSVTIENAGNDAGKLLSQWFADATPTDDTADAKS